MNTLRQAVHEYLSTRRSLDFKLREAGALLDAARTMPHRYQRGALLPWVYYCLFGLLSVTGL
jgi:hypothetical protein